MTLLGRFLSPDCVCGHARQAHEHFRRGTECSLCAPGQCARYRRGLPFRHRG